MQYPILQENYSGYRVISHNIFNTEFESFLKIIFNPKLSCYIKRKSHGLWKVNLMYCDFFKWIVDLYYLTQWSPKISFFIYIFIEF